MSDGQSLFLILCLLYLFDCLVWIGNGTILFVSPWCRRWHPKQRSRLVGNDRGSIGVFNPLPPLGSVFAGHWLPISVSPTGVSALNLRSVNGTATAARSDHVLLFEQISSVEHDEKWLLLNGARFARCATPDQAEILTGLIRRIIRELPASRETTITGFIGASFSKSDGSKRLALVTQLTSRIRWTCLTFFLFLYVVVPVAASFIPLVWYILPVAAVMWLTVPVVAVQYYRAHKTLYPSRQWERIMNVIQMALCPPVAIRTCDLLSLDAMSRFHPVLTGILLLGDNAAFFYGPIVRDMQYPLNCGRNDSATREITSWYADAERAAIAAFLKTEQPSAFEDCFAPPAWDKVSTSYCPRCLCQFIISSGKCPDCPGVGILPISDAQKKEPAHV